jgi:hypothetical protein
MLKAMLNTRSALKAFGRGDTQFLELKNEESRVTEKALGYQRTFEDEVIIVINNMSNDDLNVQHPVPDKNLIVLHAEGFLMDDSKNLMKFEPHGFAWFKQI